MESLNIYQRINNVMKVVEYVKKDAEIQGYKAVTHDQVVSVCRKALVENGIVIVPIQALNSTVTSVLKADGSATNILRYASYYEINFVNMDNPTDRISLLIEAHANDNGDKAPGKALTYATKSAIIKILSLETGINDESREEVKEKVKKLTELPKDIETQINEADTPKDLSNLWKSIQTKDRAKELESLFLDTMKAFIISCENFEELNQVWSDCFYGWRDDIKNSFSLKSVELKNNGMINPISGG